MSDEERSTGRTRAMSDEERSTGRTRAMSDEERSTGLARAMSDEERSTGRTRAMSDEERSTGLARAGALAGRLRADDIRVALVVSRFNSFVTEGLLDGALDILRRLGAKDAGLKIIRVPGAMEIPPVAARLARSGEHDAIVCLGAVIRGATPHFDHVSMAAMGGAAQVALEAADHGVAVTVGILTTESLEHAIERAGSKGGNKGADAAMAAVELVDLMRQLRPAESGA